MKKNAFLALAILSSTCITQAQQSSSFKDNLSFGISYGIAKPQGKFGNNHFSFLSPSNLGAFSEGETSDLSLADFLDNSFAKQGNEISVFAEYFKDDHFGAFIQWGQSEFDLYQGELKSLELLANEIIQDQSPLIPPLSMNVTQWKSNTIVLGPTLRQQYNKFSVQVKAAIGLLFLESPEFTVGLDQILGIPLPIPVNVMSLPQENTTSSIYTLGLSTQYELYEKTHIQIGMEYSKSKVTMEDVAIQLIPDFIDLDIPDELLEPVEFDVDYQTLNFKLGLIRNL